MAKKGFAGRAVDAAHHFVSIKNIIKAFLQGGWTSAALQALKHYWPQILAVSVALILIPIIMICCLPMIMFGYSSSTDSEISQIASHAQTVEECFNNYYTYCDNRTNQIFKEVKSYVDSGYIVVQEGYYLAKNWFIAIFSVSVGNSMIGVTEQQVVNLVNSSIVYNIENIKVDEETTVKRILIKRLSPTQVMDKLNFTQSEKDWATLMYNSLESGKVYGNNSTYTN